MKTNVNQIEILSKGTSYEIAKVEITNNGYRRVGDIVISLATGHPRRPELPRKQGVRIDSLIELLLVNIAERTNGAVESINEKHIKQVKDFMVKTVSDINFETKTNDNKI